MRFALFPNVIKPNALEIAHLMRDFLLLQGASVVAEEEKCKALGVPNLENFRPEEIDFLITLGGDGTILRVLHNHPELTSPIIGINLGSLGFMTDIPVNAIESTLGKVMNGEFEIEKRLIIEGKKEDSKKAPFAINEIVFHRDKNPCIIDLQLFVDGVYLNTFSADGLIISTPNGSTAYSLSAGGPILTPELEVLLITPICPHTISNRPIVISASKTIKVVNTSSNMPLEVTYDGLPLQTLAENEHIDISLSKREFRLVSLDGHDFFSTLRSKLGWTGRLRNSKV